MSAPKQAPKALIVFDVNVLIDAVNPASGNHAAATRALCDDNGMPIYLSEVMLKTTTNKLLEMGADPDVVREYLELIISEDDYGPEKHVLGHIPVTDYGLVDKYGKSDYEDSTVISTMDAAENDGRLPAVLVSGDAELREWCAANKRMAVRAEHLPRLTSHRMDDIQAATYQYLSRRMFRRGAPQVPREETKAQAKQMVTAAALEERYRRFPELRPERRADQSEEIEHAVPEL